MAIWRAIVRIPGQRVASGSGAILDPETHNTVPIGDDA